MQRLGRIIVLILVWGLVAACASDYKSAAPHQTDVKTPVNNNKPPLTVGVGNDIPGLGVLTSPSDNARSGFDVDLVRWLGQNTTPGFSPVLADVTIPERDEVLVDGRMGLVVDVLSITDKRRESIGLAGPYLLTRQGVLTRKDDKRISGTNDLAGKSVCTLEGSTSLDQLGPVRSKVLLTTEKGNQKCVERLLAGGVDAVSTDQLILQGYEQSYPDRLSVANFTFGSAEEYGVGFPKNDLTRCEMITEGIKNFIVSGTWNQFFRTYFPGIDPSSYRPDPETLDPCRSGGA